MKFIQNNYDPCVVNKQTEDGKITTKVHADDLKISLESIKQLQETIEHL